MKHKKILKGCGISVAVFVLIILIIVGVGAYYLFVKIPIERQKEIEERKLSRCTARDITAELSKATGYINGHGYVDLGLSVKWATYNIGASSPSDYGNYYAWGETKPKSEYTWDNYVGPRPDFIDTNTLCISGDPTYDAARVNWGRKWRLPTEEEMQELTSCYPHEIAMCGEHIGYIVTGPNGNSIFLPAAGYRDGAKMVDVGDRGIYWTGTSQDDTYTGSIDYTKLLFDALSFSCSWWDDYGPYGGLPVRPVSE